MDRKFVEKSCILLAVLTLFSGFALNFLKSVSLSNGADIFQSLFVKAPSSEQQLMAGRLTKATNNKPTSKMIIFNSTNLGYFKNDCDSGNASKVFLFFVSLVGRGSSSDPSRWKSYWHSSQ